MPRIARATYRRTAARGSPCLLNIRVRTDHRPTAAEARRTLESIVDEGVVPDGWQMLVVEWQSGKSYRSGEWIEGDVGDLLSDPGFGQGGFAALVRSELDGFRVNQERFTGPMVRKPEPEEAEAPMSRWRNVRTGRWASNSYARRYPHLVHEVLIYRTPPEPEYEEGPEYWETELALDYAP